ncbi:ADP-ribosylglycohydrolase family protein [Streptomyces rubiginosohelvolus]|uniref:ADP-ribosylglycohydrolase family protein n=1 Tax=Streptomyces rubiginosohelvolus TaxID=67362 RepID=UPI0033A302B4
MNEVTTTAPAQAPPGGAATGALFGLALGDALGFPTEFASVPAILRSGPWQHMSLPVPALVTDDTQMTLAVARAVDTAMGPGAGRLDPERFEQALAAEFVLWLDAPDNDRAPGSTCLAACARLKKGAPWRLATEAGSKGCGANMRVAPLGLIASLDSEERAGAAQLQAALTHGHPTALAAADLTAHAVWLLKKGAIPPRLPQLLRAYALSQRSRYHGRWLGDLWTRGPWRSPAGFIARGWDENLKALDRLDAALASAAPDDDPCLVTGAGWVAEEALATGLLCFLLFPRDPVMALRRAACSSGDSDSVACLTGAFAGAFHGADAWPAHWTDRVEHRDALAAHGARWDS